MEGVALLRVQSRTYRALARHLNVAPGTVVDRSPISSPNVGVAAKTVPKRSDEERNKTELGEDSKRQRWGDTEFEPSSADSVVERVVSVSSVLADHLSGNKWSKLISSMKLQQNVTLEPLQAKGNNRIVLRGSSGAVDAAEKTLRETLAKTQQRLPLTHFLSLPLRSKDLHSKITEWEQTVLQDFANASGLSPDIMINPRTFHLTLGMLSLPNPEAVAEAVDLLKKIAPQLYDVLETRSCIVSVAGLKLMTNDDEDKDSADDVQDNSKTHQHQQKAAAAHVLYFDVKAKDNSPRFINLCELVRLRFQEAGLIADSRKLKLHATIINTRHRKTSSSSRIPIDAKEILDRFSNHSFGDVRLEGVHISILRGAKDRTTGYYAHEAVVTFP